MRNLKIALSILTVFVVLSSNAQTTEEKKNITLEEIWKRYSFYDESVSGLRSMNDGLFYTVLEGAGNKRQLSKYEYKTGKQKEVLIHSKDLIWKKDTISMDAYQFSADEQKVLIANQEESIYRRSTKAFYYVYDLKQKN